MSETGEPNERCPAVRKDGSPCQGKPGPSGFCVGHAPEAAEWRRKGGRASGILPRVRKAMPEELRAIIDILRAAIGDVTAAKLPPDAARAIAGLAATYLRGIEIGMAEMERRKAQESKAPLPYPDYSPTLEELESVERERE